MKTLAIVVLQVLISLFLVAVLTPLALVYVPAMREGRVGIVVVGVGAVVIFAVLRTIWPRRII